jgi:HNH endonuclease
MGMGNYRLIWEKHNGKIPDGYHIHHIDGNHSNNNIDNLRLVTHEEHFWIHYKQNDCNAALLLSKGLNIPSEIIKEIKSGLKYFKKKTIDKSPCPNCGNVDAYKYKRYHYDNCPVLKWKLSQLIDNQRVEQKVI